MVRFSIYFESRAHKILDRWDMKYKRERRVKDEFRFRT